MRNRDTARWWSAPLIAVCLLSGCSSAQARADEVDRIAAALQLGPGSVVADVGAGDGEWSEALLELVGDKGHLFATEVDADLVAELTLRLRDTERSNFTVVRGDQNSTGLPDGCCDAALLRMVYHHFERPAEMRADLWQSLRPGGLLAIVDIVPQEQWRELDGVPDRGSHAHGIEITTLERELSDSGFERLELFENWNGDEDRYCLVLRKAEPAADAESPGR